MRQSKLFCALPEYICTPDSMAIDRHGNLVLSCPNFADEKSSGYVVKISREGKVTRVAQSPDCTGLDGGLDQPGEPIVWNGRIVVSCFDLVTGPDKVNTKHEMPATLAEIPLY